MNQYMPDKPFISM